MSYLTEIIILSGSLIAVASMISAAIVERPRAPIFIEFKGKLYKFGVKCNEVFHEESQSWLIMNSKNNFHD